MVKINLSIVFLTLVLSITCYSQATISGLRSDGVMLKNGELFFPLGFYSEGFESAEEHIYAANEMAEGGFNLMYTEHNVMSISDYSAFFDTCHSKGIFNLVSFYDPSVNIDAPMTGFINKFKDKPSVLLWSVCDGANNVPAENVIRKNDTAKNLDQNHLTYQSWYTTGIDATVGIIDVSAMQSYPVWDNGRMDRDWKLFREIVSKCEVNNKTSIANLQIYKWEDDGNRWPTAAEADVQSYLSIAAGFKGIIFYTFKDYIESKTVDISHPELWNITIQVAKEIDGKLKEAILNGFRTSTITQNNNQVYYGKWIYNHEEFVVAINASSSLKTITIPVTGTNPQPLFAYRNNTLQLSSSNLTGSLGSMEVQIYKLTDVPADVTAPAAPLVSASAISATGFSLYWLPSNDNVGVLGYEVFKDSVSIGTTKSNKMKITGLVCGTTCTITVKAYDYAGNYSNASTGKHVSTTDCGGDTQAPSIPEGLSAITIKARSFILTWLPSTDDVAVSGYDIYKNAIFYASTADTFMLLSNLQSLTSYKMTVKAKDAAGHVSDFSVPFIFSSAEDTAPSIPEGIVADSVETDGFTLYWNPSTDNIAVKGYDVFIDSSSIGTVNNPFIKIQELGCGITYGIAVRAYDEAGNI